MFDYGSNIKFSFKTNLFETNISGCKEKVFFKKSSPYDIPVWQKSPDKGSYKFSKL